MSKKLDKHLQGLGKTDQLSKDFIEGGHYVRNLYDTALIKILGKKIGLKISNYLLDISLKNTKKKKK